jgi:hypothetical protein
MILTHNNREIKLIPRKYDGIENITDYLEDFEHKRLTEAERDNLNNRLFRQAAEIFLADLEKSEKLVHEQVKDAWPILSIKVKTSDDQTYYAIKMSNNISVRCEEALYRMSPVKDSINYTNSLSRQIAPPSVEQLRMF